MAVVSVLDITGKLKEKNWKDINCLLVDMSGFELHLNLVNGTLSKVFITPTSESSLMKKQSFFVLGIYLNSLNSLWFQVQRHKTLISAILTRVFSVFQPQFSRWKEFSKNAPNSLYRRFHFGESLKSSRSASLIYLTLLSFPDFLGVNIWYNRNVIPH